MAARQARLVAGGTPHHVIQRGNRRQKVFFEKKDREHYLLLLEEIVHVLKHSEKEGQDAREKECFWFVGFIELLVEFVGLVGFG